MDTERTAPPDGAGPEPPFETAAEPARRQVSWLARIAVGFTLALAAVVVAGFVIRVPYTTIAPGEAVSLPSRVTISGAQSYSDGRGDIRLLFVREANNVNLWRYVQSRYFSSDIHVVRDSAVNPNKMTAAQLNAQALQQMADAKSAATAVALTAAGFKVATAPGLVVHDLTIGMPAIDVLHWGDVILSVDDHTITDARAINVAIAKHKVGDPVDFVVERDGKRLSVHVNVGVFTEPAELKGKKGIGVSLLERFTFPVKVTVDTTGIGGPSAGLAMSLAILDDLTPGDLTGGAHVAVTGTIDPAGDVGEIGGIEQKAVAARAAHVSLFIVPQCSPDDPAPYLASCKDDLVRAAKRAGSKIKVVPVATFAQALRVLHENGGAPVTTSTSTTSTIPTA
jgi:PDZ domain-containing protein